MAAKKLHPDANPGKKFEKSFSKILEHFQTSPTDDPNAQENFQKLQDAYNVLKDKTARWEYDRKLSPEKQSPSWSSTR